MCLSKHQPLNQKRGFQNEQPDRYLSDHLCSWDSCADFRDGTHHIFPAVALLVFLCAAECCGAQDGIGPLLNSQAVAESLEPLATPEFPNCNTGSALFICRKRNSTTCRSPRGAAVRARKRANSIICQGLVLLAAADRSPRRHFFARSFRFDSAPAVRSVRA